MEIGLKKMDLNNPNGGGESSDAPSGGGLDIGGLRTLEELE